MTLQEALMRIAKKRGKAKIQVALGRHPFNSKKQVDTLIKYAGYLDIVFRDLGIEVMVKARPEDDSGKVT